MTTTTKASIKEVISITEDIKEYVIEPNKYSRFQPGQFLQLAFGEINPYDIWPDSRAFSIASPYNMSDKLLHIIVRKGKSFTKRMIEELREGDIVNLRYPLGDFFIENNTDYLIFIAGGTGITPFLSYINSSYEEAFEGNIYVFHSVKKMKDLIHHNELLNHEQLKHNFKMRTFITRENVISDKYINRRISSSDILKAVKDIKEYKIYICGPTHFIEDLIEKLKLQGITNIYSEVWD